MKLRKQLLFVSLITLTLPWVGCQYIGEMEQTLRQSQSDTLMAMAKAVSARLGSDPAILAELANLNPPPGTSPLFVHTLSTPPIIDGYRQDWQQRELAQQSLRGRGGAMRAQMISGMVGAQLYLLMDVVDHTPSYYQPTQPSPEVADHLRLAFAPGAAPGTQLLVFASGQGKVQSAWQTPAGLVPEYQLNGMLIETSQGYVLELQMPISWSEAGLGIRLIDQAQAVDATNYTDRLPPLIKPSPLLEHELQVFRQPGIRLQIASLGARPIARVGQLSAPESQPPEHHSMRDWLYMLSVGEQHYPAIDSSDITGMLDTPEVHAALSSRQPMQRGWYQDGIQQLVRVATPVLSASEDSGVAMAVVVADQSSDSLARLTSSAFYRLIGYSTIVTFAASLTLILYASWLSFRIRKLSRAAAEAISESGKINENFPVLRSQDELGDLSRNYATLLSRLREYTNYLRTLSSKLSHELRTPLAIVKTSLDNLEYENLPDTAKVYAERAKEGTSRLSNILNAMSAASRVEQAIGAAEVELIPCQELLTNLKAAYEDVYPHARFRLNIRDDEGPLRLHGSGELLVQMFDKLVDNAADFCPDDGLIEMGLYRSQEMLVFTVHNEGPPLPTSMHGQLFDSMVSVREHPSNPERGHHLGLGLYIVRLIVDFHRGQVHCYNLPDNSGVIFEIRLPAA